MSAHNTALADLASALTAAATRIDTVLDLGVEAVTGLIGDGCAIRLVQPDGLLRTVAGSDTDPRYGRYLQAVIDGEIPEPGDDPAAGLSGLLQHDHHAVIQNIDQDTTKFSAENRATARRLHIHAALGAALRNNNQYLGYVVAVRHDTGRAFTADDSSLLTDIAARIALALVTADTVEKLRRSEEQYRLIVESTNEGIFVSDTDGKIRFVNERLTALLGCDRADILGTDARAFVSDEDFAIITGKRQERLAGESDDYEVRLIRADGQPLWVHFNVVPARGPSGAITGTMGMITDITDRVRSRELQGQLSRLRRLDNLGKLAGGAAHDLNNLLAIVGSLATELDETHAPGSATAHIAAQINQAAGKGAHLTSQLLAVGRGESTDLEIVNVVDLVTSLEPLLQHMVGARIALPVMPHPGTSRVRLATGQLEQILLNLVSNARDAIDTTGEVRISCRDMRADPPANVRTGSGNFVCIAVADDGRGMDTETQQRAFELFFTTKPAGRGTGLGLAGVQAIVRAAGGWLELQSSPAGTTVEVYLPAVPQPPGSPSTIR